MDALWIALGSAAVLWLGYRYYGRFVARRIFGAGDRPDDAMPSHARRDGVDFVPTKRSVLFGHHYVTIAGAGPIVGPAVAVTWGWMPALLWVLLGSIFIGAVHDLGSLVASVRNKGRTIGDLAADIMTPRVRTLFLAFIAMALWVVLAVFAFVIAVLFAQRPESVFAVWIEIPLAMLVGFMVHRKGASMLKWSLIALAAMYVAIWIGTLPAVKGLFAFGSSAVMIWLVLLFAYSYVASILPVTKLLQPRDYINSHQLFLALGVLLVGMLLSPLLAAGKLAVVAPAINDKVPADAPMLYPFLFITIACGAISGFHCMVASGTTARQLDSERDARSIGYGAMILEGALAVVVILCCVSAAGFKDTSTWMSHYSPDGGAFVAKRLGLLPRLEGFIQGGASYMHTAFPFLDVGLLATVITVVIISFAATTMDSATRIQRYVITELGHATGAKGLGNKHVATAIAVGSAAALALFADSGGKGGLVLWPVFGTMNQLLACFTFLVLNTWLAKRGKPVIYTTIPMLFLLVTVSYAAVKGTIRFADAGKWHLVTVLGIGLVLEGWMIVEGFSVLKMARRVRARLAERSITPAEAQVALAGPSGATIDSDGIIESGGASLDLPADKVC